MRGLLYVNVLLAAGANVHAQNDMALRVASKKGHVDVVQILLAAGADVHAQNDTALLWASEWDHKGWSYGPYVFRTGWSR